MNPEIQLITVLFLVLPVVPIAVSWRKALKPSAGVVRATRLELAVLILVTVSQAFLMTGLLWTDAIGHHYSSRRYTTIAINLVAMLGATAVAAIAGRQVRLPLALSGGCATCSWAYLAMLSSAV